MTEQTTIINPVPLTSRGYVLDVDPDGDIELTFRDSDGMVQVAYFEPFELEHMLNIWNSHPNGGHIG